jgi:Leucine-rich repeat (LRR) protein
MSQGIDQMRKTIREVEPPRPSTRVATLGADELTTTAKRRSADNSKLLHQLKGDLDWIVMKCLEKDRTRRYDTANGLAMDIKRHLNNEPVLACPPSKFYEFQKTVRRHKFGFAATAAIIVALSAGIAASVWQAKRAQREASRAVAAEQRAVTALDELRSTAPAFAEQARSLAAKEQYADAIAKLDYAIKLRPDAAEFLVAKGDLLQCQLQLAPAAAIYREALRVQPGLARAEESAKLCDELLAAKPNDQGKLTRESLAKLLLSMQEQQRPAAELLPVARQLGEEKKLILNYWLARLQALPITAEKPLEKRLTVRDDGRLALDLGNTKMIDLAVLAGAPLAVLDVSQCKALTDLSPLRGMDLVELNLNGTGVADLSPLREMHTLEKLNISDSKVTELTQVSELKLKSLAIWNCPVSDLTPLRKMPLEEIDLWQTRVSDLKQLIGMPIKTIYLGGTPVLDFSPLSQLPLEKCYFWRNRITDLSVLRGKPLKELSIYGCVEARNYAVIAEMKTLELLLLPAEYRSLPDDDFAAIASLRNHPKLRQLSSDDRPYIDYAQTGAKEVFWQDWDRELPSVQAIRKGGFDFSLSKLSDGTYELYLSRQPFSDLSILKDVPFSILRLRHTTVADLTPLRGMPLTSLALDGCDQIRDVSPLASIASLKILSLPSRATNIETLLVLTNLDRLGYDWNNLSGKPDQKAATFWKEFDKDWIHALSRSGFAFETPQKLADDTWQVGLGKSKISDLTFLHGAPISDLRIQETAVTDLTPLRGMPLKRLFIYSTKVADLSPLQGMPLVDLSASGTQVTNLSALAGMPLTSLRLHDCSALTDVSPLAACKELNNVTLPRNATNIECLRTLPKLERLSFKADPNNGYGPDMTAAEFWKEYDAKRKSESKQP